jgi:hypothetical protein
MMGAGDRECGRRGHVGQHSREGLLALCVWLGVLSIGVGVARASVAVPAVTPAGAPGGPTIASATQLYNGLSYRGTVERGRALWYRFKAENAGRADLEVWGRTRSCPIRATVTGPRGGALGEIISSTSEILPFSVPLRVHSDTGLYYVRIDTDPYTACAGAGYVFTLSEPEQPGPLPSEEPSPSQTASPPSSSPSPGSPPRTGTMPSKESASPVPQIEQGNCGSALDQLRRATIAVERERALVRRHRAGIGTLRSVEAQKLTARRRERAICGY